MGGLYFYMWIFFTVQGGGGVTKQKEKANSKENEKDGIIDPPSVGGKLFHQSHEGSSDPLTLLRGYYNSNTFTFNQGQTCNLTYIDRFMLLWEKY